MRMYFFPMNNFVSRFRKKLNKELERILDFYQDSFCLWKPKVLKNACLEKRLKKKKH